MRSIIVYSREFHHHLSMMFGFNYRGYHRFGMERENDTDLTLFMSSNCAPCEMMKRKLDELKREMSFSMKIVNIDLDDKTSLHGFRVAPVIKIKDEVVVGEVDLEDLRCTLMRNLYSRV